MIAAQALLFVQTMFGLPQYAAPVHCEKAEAMLGAWEYLEPLWPGRSVLVQLGSKYLYVFVQTHPDRPITSAPKLEAEKAAAYETALAGAWELTCEGDLLKWTVLYSLNPAQPGRELLMAVEFEGELARFWFVRPDGTRATGGVARRLKSE